MAEVQPTEMIRRHSVENNILFLCSNRILFSAFLVRSISSKTWTLLQDCPIFKAWARKVHACLSSPPHFEADERTDERTDDAQMPWIRRERWIDCLNGSGCLFQSSHPSPPPLSLFNVAITAVFTSGRKQWKTRSSWHGIAINQMMKHPQSVLL